MKTISKKILMSALYAMVFLLFSCAHHNDVRPGSDGINIVKARGTDKERAEQNAIKQATLFCKESNKIPGFVAENTQYTGTMDEKSRNAIRTASKAGAIIGNSVGGAVLEPASQIGGVVTSGKDYIAEMQFKCQ